MTSAAELVSILRTAIAPSSWVKKQAVLRQVDIMKNATTLKPLVLMPSACRIGYRTHLKT